MRKVLATKTTIRSDGKPKRITIFHALLMKELDLAVDGDWRARKTVLELGLWALPEEAPEWRSAGATPPRDVDRAIIAWFEDEPRACRQAGRQ